MPRAAKPKLAPKAPDALPVGPPAPPRLFAGTSGWAYPTWKPGFYPAGLPQKRFLPFYSSQLTSVEVNYTFRTLPTARLLGDWLASTAPGFRFSFKAPQRITHFARLRDCDALVAQLLAALAPARDAGKLGLLLFQLPPNLPADPARLAAFLASPVLRSSGPLASEFRHPTWFTPEIERILRDHDAALCIAESELLETPELHTARSHTAFRLRKPGGYTPAELAAFASRLLALTHAASSDGPRDVYAYFKHEDEPTGALNARDFLALAANQSPHANAQSPGAPL